MPVWLITVLISIALNVVAYVITPKNKAKGTSAVREIEGPTAEDGKPLAMIFGEEWIKSPNVIWTGDKAARAYEIKA